MDWQTQIKSTTVNRFKQKKGSIKNNYTEKRRKIIRVKMRSANFWYFSCHRKQEKKKQHIQILILINNPKSQGKRRKSKVEKIKYLKYGISTKNTN